MAYLLGILLGLSSLILILLVLIQQGRGGGLAGAFGGMGGQSAFGTKAGDLFTKITIFVAAFWILMCVATVKWASATPARLELVWERRPDRPWFLVAPMRRMRINRKKRRARRPRLVTRDPVATASLRLKKVDAPDPSHGAASPCFLA